MKHWDGNRKRNAALRRTKHHLGERNILKGLVGEIAMVEAREPGVQKRGVLLTCGVRRVSCFPGSAIPNPA